MCTLTWWNGPEAYEIFFNRDESKARAPALPPAVHQAPGGTRFLAPRDGEAGGTWILANERGVTLTILNYYEHESHDTVSGRHRSRGRLLWDLGGAESLETVETNLRGWGLSRYKAFTLLGYDLNFGFRTWLWRFDGERLAATVRNPALPVCSSGFQPAGVTGHRTERLEALSEGRPVTPDLLEKYQHDREGGPSAFSVLMNRPDAQTWSVSHVKMMPEKVQFIYEELPPDLAGEAVLHTREMPRP